MREALTQIEAIASARCAWDIATIAKTALAEPVRNCEVGTAEEQSERFESYCGRCNASTCDHRMFADEAKVGCVLAWAQMPYTKGATDGR